MHSLQAQNLFWSNYSCFCHFAVCLYSISAKLARTHPSFFVWTLNREWIATCINFCITNRCSLKTLFKPVYLFRCLSHQGPETVKDTGARWLRRKLFPHFSKVCFPTWMSASLNSCSLWTKTGKELIQQKPTYTTVTQQNEPQDRNLYSAKQRGNSDPPWHSKKHKQVLEGW